MLLGILQTGRMSEDIAERFGDYPDIYGSFFLSADPALAVKNYRVIDSHLPEGPDVCDAWVVTGSRHGVYDDEPWIEPLKDFLRAARAARVPLVGICFGHQIMAEAFGGRAEKSNKGWGCGVHQYQIERVPGWLSASGNAIAMHAMHQDQITAIPPDATPLASSPFCEYAMLTYGDPEAPEAISIQPHPEFGTDLARTLVELRMGEYIPMDRAEAALETFGSPVDNDAFAEWSLAYLRLMLARRQAA